MPFGKEIWHGIRQALRADQYYCHFFVKYMILCCLSADLRGSTMLWMCPWESHHCMYVTLSPWELMGCLLSGHICTDYFRFRRQLMWTFLEKSAVRTFQGGVHWINSAWTSSDTNGWSCRSGNIFDCFVVQEDRHVLRDISIFRILLSLTDFTL